MKLNKSKQSKNVEDRRRDRVSKHSRIKEAVLALVNQSSDPEPNKKMGKKAGVDSMEKALGRDKKKIASQKTIPRSAQFKKK